MFGRWLDELGGEYVAAEELGMTVEHMKKCAGKQLFVTGIGTHRAEDGAQRLCRIEAALEGKVTGTRIAVQGLCSVGLALVDSFTPRGRDWSWPISTRPRCSAQLRLAQSALERRKCC